MQPKFDSNNAKTLEDLVNRGIPARQLSSLEPEKLIFLLSDNTTTVLLNHGIDFEKFAIQPLGLLKEFFSWLKEDPNRLTSLDSKDSNNKIEIERKLWDMTSSIIQSAPHFLETLAPFASPYLNSGIPRLPNQLLSGKDRVYEDWQNKNYNHEGQSETSLNRNRIFTPIKKETYCGFEPGFLNGKRF